MTKRASLWARLRALWRRDRAESELAEELQFHLEMQTRKHRAAGMSEADALARARLEFGNLELVKEDARDVRGARPLEDFFADVRYGVRGLLRTPVFALSVILTIGLGVGLNTSVFTIFDAYVLRPFDIRDPYSLYSLQWLDRSGHMRDFAPADLEELRRPSPVVNDVAAFRTFGARLGSTAATGDAVSDNYFHLTGVRAALGRTIVSGDRYLPVIVLAYGTWQNRFGADSTIVGKTIAIRGASFRVVGVAQSGFEGFFKKPRDFWIPLDAQLPVDASGVASAEAQPVSLLVRLAPGTSASQGSAFFGSTLQRMTDALPDSARSMRAVLTSRATAIAPSVRAFLAFAPLVAAFVLILVLACANVANMLLARAVARQRGAGTRLALGAERARLVRQLMTEAIVLALPAIALGYGMASLIVGLGVRTLFATLPPDLTAFVRLVPLHPDLRVLGFAFVASVGAALLFGLAPALQATRLSLVDAMRGNFAGPSSNRLRGMLVVGQIAASSLLLTIAGVLVREAARLGKTDTGLRTRDVVSIELQDKSRSQVIDALHNVGSVDALAAASSLPLDMRFSSADVRGSDSSRVPVLYNRVSSAYFNVLGIPVVAGRGFNAREEMNAAPVVIVSETAARRLWPGASPLGQVVRFAVKNAGADPITRYQNAAVIGVARDVVVNSIEDGRDRPVLYVPQSVDAGGCCLLVRVRGDPVTAKRALDEHFEKNVPGAVDRIDLLDTFVVGAVYPYRVAYWVALALGGLALALTVIGVYGLVGYLVSQRVREIGVRIALGAQTMDVLWLVMRQSMRQAAIGATIGAVIALAAARVLAASVQSMPRFDGVALAGAFMTVIAACAVAALLPSRRAVAVDPTVALRQD